MPKYPARLQEFFEVEGSFAMRNLVVFIITCVSSLVVLYIAFIGKLTSEIFVPYVGIGAMVYGYGKNQDTRAAVERMKNADNSSVSK